MPILVYRTSHSLYYRIHGLLLCSYPWCVSLLLNHIHSRQLAWEKAASSESRIINLRAAGQHRGFIQ